MTSGGLPVPSKTAVDRAGEALVAAYRADDELPDDAFDLVARWREHHCDALVWITTSIRGRTAIPVSYRLKRLPQIVAKLARAGRMRLVQMQDIGGCRLVVETQDDADRALRAVVQRSAPRYEVVRVTDYRTDGRERTGYRALHVILRRNDVALELQIRTRRQHAWAEAVERAANRTGFRLKDGEGPDELVGYFRAASDCLAELEEGRKPKGLIFDEFRRGDEGLSKFFPDLPDASGASGFLVREKSFSTRENNWLLLYDWKGGKPVRWMDCGTDCVEAARRYSEWEKSYPSRSGYEVVLIGSDSQETIEWTHAHYFGRSADDLDPHGVLAELRAA